MYTVTIKQITDIQDSIIEEVIAVCAQIPEFDKPYSKNEYQTRLQNRTVLLQYIYVEDELAGFKLGYSTQDNHFYSWLGGILPDFRKLGLAELLLKDQELWVSTQGFTAIEVKTLNRFGAMLSMLVKHSYEIMSVDSNQHSTSLNKLYLQKLI